MNPKIIPEIIIDLVERKNYSELNAQERGEVGKYFSATEYQSHHDIIELFQSVDRKLHIETPLSRSEQASNQARFKGLLFLKLPLYQVAAIGLILMVSTLVTYELGVQNHTSVAKDFFPALHEPNFYMQEEAADRQSDNIKRTVNEMKTATGTSLVEENYPEALVMNL